MMNCRTRKVARLFLVALFILSLATAAQSAEMVYNSWNAAGVDNGPSVDTTFTLTKPTTIASIVNYHWNYGQGQDPNPVAGWIGIEQIVDGAANIEIGRWPVTSKVGAYGSLNTWWFIYPNVQLGAGSYKIVDSHNASWSYANYSYAPYGTVPFGDGPNWELYKGFSQLYAAPVATATLPANGATAVPTRQVLTVTFSENVVQGPAWNNIKATYVTYVAGKPTTVSVPLTKTLKGNILKITPKSSYRTNALVTVTIPAGSVLDLGFTPPGATIVEAGSPSAAYQYSFTTAP